MAFEICTEPFGVNYLTFLAPQHRPLSIKRTANTTPKVGAHSEEVGVAVLSWLVLQFILHCV